MKPGKRPTGNKTGMQSIGKKSTGKPKSKAPASTIATGVQGMQGGKKATNKSKGAAGGGMGIGNLGKGNFRGS